MQHEDKGLFTLTARIRDRLLAGQSGRVDFLKDEVNHAISHMERLCGIHRKLDLCTRHGFLAAGQKLREDLPYLLADLNYGIQAVERAAQTKPPLIPTSRDLVLDLQQVQTEFGEYKYDSEAKTLSVETDPIELEGISLGAFRIELHLDQLGTKRQQSALRIVALDPNPPASNDSVTHPHVSDERLCTGDATTAIEAALSSGRIADLFMLVQSVLTTYNPHSPYVALDSWHGTPCAECGYTIADDDDRYTCQRCDSDFCSECTTSCNTCDETICLSCATKCPLCEEYHCKSCLETCDRCDRELCRNCKVDGLCPDCQEKEQQDEQESRKISEVAEAGAVGA